MSNYDRWVGLVGIAFSLGLIFSSFGIETPEWGDVVGPTFWPRLLCAGLLAVSVFLVIKPDPDGASDGAIGFRHFFAFGAAVLYVLALPILGFLIVTPVFIAFGYLAVGANTSRRRIGEALFAAAAGTAAIYLVFQVLLETQLPSGQLF